MNLNGIIMPLLGLLILARVRNVADVKHTQKLFKRVPTRKRFVFLADQPQVVLEAEIHPELTQFKSVFAEMGRCGEVGKANLVHQL